MGILVNASLGRRNAYPLEHFNREVEGLLVRVPQVQPGELGEPYFDREKRIQGSHRVQKNHRDLVSANFCQAAFGHLQ